jgi:hypothetical protein
MLALLKVIVAAVIYSRMKNKIGLLPFIFASLFWYTFVSPVNVAIVALFVVLIFGSIIAVLKTVEILIRIATNEENLTQNIIEEFRQMFFDRKMGNLSANSRVPIETKNA